MKRFPLIVALMLPLTVDAMELNFSVGSYHMGRPSDADLREVNPGVAVVLDNCLMFGAYRNSFNSETYFTGCRKERGKWGFELGVSSYGNFKWHGDREIVPIGQVTYDVLENFRIGLVPAWSPDYFGILTFQFTFGE